VGPVCKVCRHPDLGAIDGLIRARESLRVISDRFCLKYSTVQRHSATHLTRGDVKARFVEGSKAPDRIQDAHARLDRIIRNTMRLKDYEVAIKALKERREYLAYERPPVQKVELSEAVRKLTPEQVEAELQAALAEIQRRKGEV
jgi:hypothetical protein